MEEKENTFELAEPRDALNLVPRRDIQGWWFFAAVAAVAAIVLLILLLKRKSVKVDLTKDRREAYEAAKKALASIDSESPRETALEVSRVLRAYLAKSLGNPALFETHEEFIGRHDGLKDFPEDVRSEIAEFFSELAALKYAPTEEVSTTPGEIRVRGGEILEKAHNS